MDALQWHKVVGNLFVGTLRYAALDKWRNVGESKEKFCNKRKTEIFLPESSNIKDLTIDSIANGSTL